LRFSFDLGCHVFWFWMDLEAQRHCLVELARTPERASAIVAGWTSLASCMPRLAWVWIICSCLLRAYDCVGCFAGAEAAQWLVRFLEYGWVGSLAAPCSMLLKILPCGKPGAWSNVTWPQVAFWCASFKVWVDSDRIGFAYWVRFCQSPCRLRNKKSPLRNERDFVSEF